MSTRPILREDAGNPPLAACYKEASHISESEFLSARFPFSKLLAALAPALFSFPASFPRRGCYKMETESVDLTLLGQRAAAHILGSPYARVLMLRCSW
jgi:hypothetical protein